MRRDVLQIFHPDGNLLAEHDWIHEDPEYASHYLRDARAMPTEKARNVG